MEANYVDSLMLYNNYQQMWLNSSQLGFQSSYGSDQSAAYENQMMYNHYPHHRHHQQSQTAETSCNILPCSASSISGGSSYAESCSPTTSPEIGQLHSATDTSISPGYHQTQFPWSPMPSPAASFSDWPATGTCHSAMASQSSTWQNQQKSYPLASNDNNNYSSFCADINHVTDLDDKGQEVKRSVGTNDTREQNSQLPQTTPSAPSEANMGELSRASFNAQLARLGGFVTLRKARTTFDQHQILRLEDEFCTHRYLTADQRKTVAKDLHMTERQVKIWFQNRRMKEKRGPTNPASSQNTTHIIHQMYQP